MPIIYMSYVLGFINTFVDDSASPSDTSMCVCRLPTEQVWEHDAIYDFDKLVTQEIDDGSCDGFISTCIDGFTGADATAIHQDFLMNNSAVQLLIIPYAGMMADSVEPFVALPVAFAVRMGLALMFIFFVNDPRDDWYIFMSCALNACGTFELTIVEGLFKRNLPSDIRGGMLSAFTFSGSFFKIFLTIIMANIFQANIPNDKSVYWALIVADGVLLALSLVLGCCGYLKAPEPKVMPKPKKVIKDSEDEHEDDGFFADTEVKNDEFRDAGPPVFASKDAAGQAGQLARGAMLDLAGSKVTGGNTNIYSVARPKGEPKSLPISDHNVFNCEERLLESAATHEQEMTEAEKNQDFEELERQKDMKAKYAFGYRAGFEAARTGGPAEPPKEK